MMSFKSFVLGFGFAAVSMSQSLYAYELQCGQFVTDNDVYAKVKVDSDKVDVEFRGFTFDAPGFAIDAMKTLNLPLDFLNRQFGFYKINFSVPRLTNDRKLTFITDKDHPSTMQMIASKLENGYGSIPVTATVKFEIANTASVTYQKVPLEFLGIENYGRFVTTTTPVGRSVSTDNYIQLRLSSGALKVQKPCNALNNDL